jgi:hypothetical protein
MRGVYNYGITLRPFNIIYYVSKAPIDVNCWRRKFIFLDSINSHYSANACLTPLCALHGLAITTVEGIGDSSGINDQGQKKRRLHGILCFITLITCLFNTDALFFLHQLQLFKKDWPRPMLHSVVRI